MEDDYFIDNTNELHLFMAFTCFASELFEEAYSFMKQHLLIYHDLTKEECDLFFGIFKELFGVKRRNWQLIVKYEEKKGITKFKNSYLTLRQKIEKEILNYTLDCLQLIDKFILPYCKIVETKVFFLKMKADHLIAISIFNFEKQPTYTDEASKIYEDCYKLASTGLEATHPLRLYLVFNYSNFSHDILKKYDKALKIVKDGYEDPEKLLSSLDDEDNFKQASLFLELIMNNRNLWSSDYDQPEDKDQKYK